MTDQNLVTGTIKAIADAKRREHESYIFGCKMYSKYHDGHAKWTRKNAHLRDKINKLQARIKELEELAANAYRAWDADNDSRVGKILRAMTDENFRKSYLPKG